MEIFNSQYQELYHHGITGQKWGAKNGPPYPLSGSQMTAVQRAKNSVSKFAQDRAKVKVAKETEKRKKIQRKISVEKAKEKTKAKQEELKNLKEQNKVAAKSEKQKIKELNINSKKDTINNLTNDQLRARNDRIRLEQEYASLTTNVSKGKAFKDEAIKTGLNILQSSIQETGKAWLTKQLKDNLGLKEEPVKDPMKNIKDSVDKLKLEKSLATLQYEKKNNWNLDKEEKKKK